MSAFRRLLILNLMLNLLGPALVVFFTIELKADTAALVPLACTRALYTSHVEFDLHVLSFVPAKKERNYLDGFMDGKPLTTQAMIQTGQFDEVDFREPKDRLSIAYGKPLYIHAASHSGFDESDAIRSHNPFAQIGLSLIESGSEIASDAYKTDAKEAEVTDWLERRSFLGYFLERRISNATILMEFKNNPVQSFVGNLRVVDVSNTGNEILKSLGYSSNYSEAELLLLKQGIHVRKIEEWRAKGKRIFFLERFAIPSIEVLIAEQEPVARAAVKKALYQWFFLHFLGQDGYPDDNVIFAFETVTPQGQKAAQNDFGAEFFSPDDFEPRLENPNLLFANRATARKMIQQAIRKLSQPQ